MELVKIREQEALEKFFLEKASHYELEMAFLYGSWARGFPREDSDIDIALLFSGDPNSEEELLTRMTDISLSLSERLRREVNSIIIRPNFDKPLLYYNAVILGIPVFIADRNKYIELRNQAIYQMEDYCIFGPGWQLRAAQQNLEALKNA